MDEEHWQQVMDMVRTWAEHAAQFAQPSVQEKPKLFPLVEEDELFFTVVLPKYRRNSLTAKNCDRDGLPAIGKTFFETFNQVWQQIHRADRFVILRHWHEPVVRRYFPFRPPLIQVIDTRFPLPKEARFQESGNRLDFCGTLIREHRDCLPGEIAATLADVHLVASGEHWRLVTKYLEDPMKDWEALLENHFLHDVSAENFDDPDDDECHHFEIIEAASEEKYSELTAEFLRHYRVAIATILERWDFAAEAGK